MSEKIELALVELIKTHRFYAEVLLRMKKVADTSIPTIGVQISPDGITLLYNPHCFDQFELGKNLVSNDPKSIGSAAEVLKHECEHILRNHFERRKESEPDLFKDSKYNDIVSNILDTAKKTDTAMLLNVAEDLAINEMLPNLPDTIKLFDKTGKPVLDESGKPIEFATCKVIKLQAAFPKIKIERNQTTEYYYKLLKKIREQNDQPNQGQNGMVMLPFDSHEQLGDSTDQLDPEIAKEITKQLINAALDAVPSNDRGNIPGHILEMIEKLNERTKDWRKELRQFKESCMSILQEETRRRRNRRYGLLYPGRRSKPKLHLVVAKDTSGSVPDEAESQFDAEISAMNKLGVDVTVIDCDSKIQQVYTFHKRKRKPTMGRGGTAFAPVFKHVAHKDFKKEYGKVDGIIYLTDGENFDINEVEKPKCKVLWALLPGCRVAYDWGQKTYIEISKRK